MIERVQGNFPEEVIQLKVLKDESELGRVEVGDSPAHMTCLRNL